MIASHNTFSYLPVQKWWMKLLSPWHRCQNEGLIAQLANGVQYLDIRVRFTKEGKPVFVHNNITYNPFVTVNSSSNSFVPSLEYLLGKTKVYFIGMRSIILNQSLRLNPSFPKKIPFRLILDVRKVPKDYVRQRVLFNTLIKILQGEPYCNYLTLDEARIFWDWDDPIIKSKYEIKEIHTSVCSKWYQYLLGTKWFAKRHNPSTFQAEKEDKTTVYLIDYVNIGTPK